jgi:hypothetical protein
MQIDFFTVITNLLFKIMVSNRYEWHKPIDTLEVLNSLISRRAAKN